MLRLNLTPLFRLRSIKRPYSYMMKLGFSHDVAKRLSRNEPTGIQLRHMAKLCEALYCTPNDLLEYSEEAGHLSAQHPLRGLGKDRFKATGLLALNQLPLEKVQELQAYLQKLQNED